MNLETLEHDVLLARNGDEAAFQRVVERTGATVCSIALAISRNVHASEDIAQETFLAAWKGLRNLRNPASFLAWLREMTRNQARLWWRAHGREVTGDEAIAAAVDSRPSPAHALLDSEEQQILNRVLDEIPDDNREVLVLYYREDCSTSQVALLLGISEDAVRQRLSRSRTLVREEVMKRFGSTVRATAPGAAFIGSVAAALTAIAPPATAAVAGSAAAAGSVLGSAAVAKASLLGGALGWTGVLIGMRYLGSPFDEQEGRELRRFRNIALAVITIGCLAIALSAPSTLAMLITIQATYGAIIYLYAVKLPKILERRMAWDQAHNPAEAKKNRRQWMWATISHAAAAALGGAVIMAILLRGLL